MPLEIPPLGGLASVGEERQPYADLKRQTGRQTHGIPLAWRGDGEVNARDIMKSPVVTIRPDDTVLEAAELMLLHNISCLPVMDEPGRIVGIITHSDFGLHHRFLPTADTYLYTLLGSSASPETVEEVAQKVRGRHVKEVMSHPVETVQEETSLAQVTDLMLRKRVHRLPVMRGTELVGVISRHDLLKLVLSGQE
jgi:CBS domain-containing protein